MLTYPGVIHLPSSTLAFLTDLLQAHRDQLSTWRKLSARDQATLVLAHLRNGDTYTRLADGFEVGVATVFRYIHEAVGLLAELGLRARRHACWNLSVASGSRSNRATSTSPAWRTNSATRSGDHR